MACSVYPVSQTHENECVRCIDSNCLLVRLKYELWGHYDWLICSRLQQQVAHHQGSLRELWEGQDWCQPAGEKPGIFTAGTAMSALVGASGFRALLN